MMITCFNFCSQYPTASSGVLTLVVFAKCSCKHGTWLITRGNKKTLLSENFFSGTRAYASCYHPKFTDTSRYRPYQLRTRNDSSIVYHCNGCTRRSLGKIASVRGSKTIFSNSFCACSHLIRLSVTYLTAYSSLHSLCFYFCK